MRDAPFPPNHPDARSSHQPLSGKCRGEEAKRSRGDFGIRNSELPPTLPFFLRLCPFSARWVHPDIREVSFPVGGGFSPRGRAVTFNRSVHPEFRELEAIQMQRQEAASGAGAEDSCRGSGQRQRQEGPLEKLRVSLVD